MNATKKYTQLVLLFGAIVFLMSCSRNGDGDIITKQLPMNHYDTLSIDGVFEVHLVEDGTNSIEFIGEQRNVERCKAEFADGQMVISGSKRGEFLHPNEKTTQVIIHFDSLALLNVHSDCRIVSEQFPITGREFGVVCTSRYMEADLELACHTFYYWNNPNATHLLLYGQTDQLKIWNAGLGTVDASQVTSDYVLVTNGGQNNCSVRALQTLEYSLTSVGNIIYYGNPASISAVEVNGAGELIKGD